MHSFLISSKNNLTRETEAMLLCKKAGVDPFDIVVIERGEGDEKKAKLSLGIEDVKIMQKKLFLKPFRGEKKAVIIHDAHLLTTEAQNALLKVLEEPPINTIIILTSDNEDALLPTVRSRVSIISLTEEALSISSEEQKLLVTLLTEIPQWEAGKALKFAEKLAKNKDDALLWLEKMIIINREFLISHLTSTSSTSDEQRYYLHLLKSFQHTYTQIKTTNVNLRLALENLFLR